MDEPSTERLIAIETELAHQANGLNTLNDILQQLNECLTARNNLDGAERTQNL
jgi:uncharacterized coiled-coil protein SlyX